ncbi:BgTH12-00672 [Blumeria graminis f. sp. triticale]|uniref:BgtE-10006 n=3 Tax=Blumeria graminis TaxID=34373 RepID=A0A381L926_BLUGR|nr:putative secreted effector protein [Blumeria graminis f. sp. tritici 96224]CAD6505177.1 BgTH12-00672 [Blumeria graminis f. sp. triticale]VDB93189.1 BgtE-10006 [Blumeria graminis f. sp. tritici]
MNCINAILLHSPNNSHQIDRLVITGGGDYDFYGVYQPRLPDYFPIYALNSDKLASQSKFTTLGTYQATYCSEKISHKNIIALVTQSLEPLPVSEQYTFKRRPIPEDDCMRYIQTQSTPTLEKQNDEIELKLHNKPHKAPIKLSRLLRTEVCTLRYITSLAFERKIDVDGRYACFAPSEVGGIAKVTADRPVRTQDLFLGSRLSRGKHLHNRLRALTWYQGHLHLFRWDLLKRIWCPLTNLTPEPRNGALIAEFLAQNSLNLHGYSLYVSHQPKNIKDEGNHNLESKSSKNPAEKSVIESIPILITLHEIPFTPV